MAKAVVKGAPRGRKRSDKRAVAEPAKIDETIAAAPAVAKARTNSARAKAPVKASAAQPLPSQGDPSSAVAPTTGPCRIFQIYYEDWHRDLLDPMFIPYSNVGTPSELMEFDIFERIAQSAAVQGADYWGALSWRFTEKTGMIGADLIREIGAHPEADVFFCNPHAHNEALYHNMWVQGETSHPRFLEIAGAFFDAVGLPKSEFELTMPSGSFSAANYFVGKPSFWDAYLPFVRKLVTIAEQKMAPEMRKLLHSKAADDRGLHGGSTYLPFIIERIFPIFLRAAAGKIQAHRITLPVREHELNIHLKLLRDMKDVAIRTKSPWLAACWVNYRALYFSQHHGRDWCHKYLRAITPAQIAFN